MYYRSHSPGTLTSPSVVYVVSKSVCPSCSDVTPGDICFNCGCITTLLMASPNRSTLSERSLAAIGSTWANMFEGPKRYRKNHKAALKAWHTARMPNRQGIDYCKECDPQTKCGRWSALDLAAEDEEDSLFGRVNKLVSWNHLTLEEATAIYTAGERLAEMWNYIKHKIESSLSEDDWLEAHLRRYGLNFTNENGISWTEADFGAEDRQDSFIGRLTQLIELGCFTKHEVTESYAALYGIAELWNSALDQACTNDDSDAMLSSTSPILDPENGAFNSQLEEIGMLMHARKHHAAFPRQLNHIKDRVTVLDNQAEVAAITLDNEEAQHYLGDDLLKQLGVSEQLIFPKSEDTLSSQLAQATERPRHKLTPTYTVSECANEIESHLGRLQKDESVSEDSFKSIFEILSDFEFPTAITCQIALAPQSDYFEDGEVSPLTLDSDTLDSKMRCMEFEHPSRPSAVLSPNGVTCRYFIEGEAYEWEINL